MHLVGRFDREKKSFAALSVLFNSGEGLATGTTKKNPSPCDGGGLGGGVLFVVPLPLTFDRLSPPSATVQSQPTRGGGFKGRVAEVSTGKEGLERPGGDHR